MNALKFGMMIGQMAKTLTNNETITKKVAQGAKMLYDALSKAWNWIKKAANWSTGGASSLYLYGGLLLAGAAAALAVVSWHADKVADAL